MTIDELLKKASPRPWTHDMKEHNISGWTRDILDLTKKTIAVIRPYAIHEISDIPNADFIVIAVNNFERMREALKKISEVDSTWFRDPITNDNSAVKRIAKEALKEIEK